VTPELIAFAGLSVILVASALAVVLGKNLFHAVLFLAVTLTGTAGLFVLLEAEFLAAVQLLLYAGGVITIVVFAIVVTERLVGERLSQTSRSLGSGALVAAALLLSLLIFLRQSPLPAERPPLDVEVDVTRTFGDVLLTRYVLPFEVLGLLFLVGLLGATYLARPED
jgi:NADH:ubiquinone oxidoreductase subunit 6 (subunit J)